jgi:hypothetical protein
MHLNLINTAQRPFGPLAGTLVPGTLVPGALVPGTLVLRIRTGKARRGREGKASWRWDAPREKAHRGRKKRGRDGRREGEACAPQTLATRTSSRSMEPDAIVSSRSCNQTKGRAKKEPGGLGRGRRMTGGERAGEGTRAVHPRTTALQREGTRTPTQSSVRCHTDLQIKISWEVRRSVLSPASAPAALGSGSPTLS